MKLAIVDVETTGPRPLTDRVIEIGILRVEDGQVVETFHSLINPEKRLPPEITMLTGITGKDLEAAPTFSDVQKDVRRLLDGCVFVAHNVRFDYGFIRNEFSRNDRDFTARCLCTVRLSRRLFPEFKRHSLDSLIERYGFECSNRHRAFDDAQVLWHFLQHVQSQFPEAELEAAIQHGLKMPSVPPRLSPQLIQNLPDGPGVYIFQGEGGAPLYVGKSVHIRDRVYSHFSQAHESNREMAMFQQVDSIKAIETPGELAALLLEIHLIKKLKPLYNKRSRANPDLIALKKVQNDHGYDTVEMVRWQEWGDDDLDGCLGVFRTRKQVQTVLEELADENGLCLKILGFEKGPGPCFQYQIKRCPGACVGKETPLHYNARFAGSFSVRRFQTWPYSGPVLIEEKAPDGKSGTAFLVEGWRVLGGYQFSEFDQTQILPREGDFDYDTYQILARFLKNPGKQVKVRKLKAVEAEKFLSEFSLM